MRSTEFYLSSRWNWQSANIDFFNGNARYDNGCCCAGNANNGKFSILGSSCVLKYRQTLEAGPGMSDSNWLMQYQIVERRLMAQYFHRAKSVMQPLVSGEMIFLSLFIFFFLINSLPLNESTIKWNACYSCGIRSNKSNAHFGMYCVCHPTEQRPTKNKENCECRLKIHWVFFLFCFVIRSCCVRSSNLNFIFDVRLHWLRGWFQCRDWRALFSEIEHQTRGISSFLRQVNGK